MKTDPETGIREDGVFVGTALQKQLTSESLKIIGELEALVREYDKLVGSDPKGVQTIRLQMCTLGRRLEEIHRQQGEEQQRLNKLWGIR